MKKILIISGLVMGVAGLWFWKKNSFVPESVDSKTAQAQSHSEGVAFSGTSEVSTSPSHAPAVSQNSKYFSSAPASRLSNEVGAPATVEIGGTPARAAVTVKGKQISLSPNEVGYFPKVLLGTNERVKIVVSYPEGTPNDPLVIQAEDGGHLDQGEIVKQGKLDDAKQIAFEFETGVNDGVYRVTVRKGFDEKRLDFWVGPELQIRKGS